MTTFAAVLVSVLLAQGNDLRDRLDHKVPTIRAAAAKLAGLEGNTSTVGTLVRLLRDDVAEVRQAAQESLVQITRRSDLSKPEEWDAWWEKEGRTAFPETTVTEDRVRRLAQEEFDRERANLETRIRDARGDVRWMTAVMALAIILFLGVMIYFVGHVSARIRSWRELVARAEVYIKQSQELTERTDRIAAELEAKKAELREFLSKLREESESGFERHADILGKNLENRVREDLLLLRQKAEKELEQTVAGFKAELEAMLRQALAEARDRR